MNYSRLGGAVVFGFVALGAAPPQQKNYLVRVTPAEFFTGELERLKPHVDFQAKCLKVTTRPGYECRPTFEMWCDGEPVDSARFVSSPRPGAGELTWSWREKIVDGKTYYDLRTGGVLTHYRLIEVPQSKQKIVAGFGPLTLDKPVELASEGASVIVWAVGTEAADARGGGGDPRSVTPSSKTVPWVLVLRLRVQKSK